jgi:hypothetical protein
MQQTDSLEERTKGDIKFYAQTREVTCGPACVLMTRKLFGEDIPLTREEELRVWEQTKTNNGRLAYCTHPRMASLLMKSGYQCELWHTEAQGFVYRGGMKYWDFHTRMKYYNKYRSQAEQEGMSVKIHPFTARDIAQEAGRNDTVVMVLTKYGDSHQIFHHQLVYGVEGGDLRMACPLDGIKVVSYENFDRIMAIPHGRGALVIRKSLQGGKT